MFLGASRVRSTDVSITFRIPILERPHTLWPISHDGLRPPPSERYAYFNLLAPPQSAIGTLTAMH